MYSFNTLAFLVYPLYSAHRLCVGAQLSLL